MINVVTLPTLDVVESDIDSHSDAASDDQSEVAVTPRPITPDVDDIPTQDIPTQDIPAPDVEGIAPELNNHILRTTIGGDERHAGVQDVADEGRDNEGGDDEDGDDEGGDDDRHEVSGEGANNDNDVKMDIPDLSDSEESEIFPDSEWHYYGYCGGLSRSDAQDRLINTWLKMMDEDEDTRLWVTEGGKRHVEGLLHTIFTNHGRMRVAAEKRLFTFNRIWAILADPHVVML